MDLLTEALLALPQPSKESAVAYREAMPRLIRQVNELLGSHPGLERILGGVPLERIEQNHAHHAQFMADILTSGDFRLLGRVLVWAYHAYTAHGVSPQYFELEIPAWMQAIRQCIRPEHAASILAVYEEIHRQHRALVSSPCTSLYPPISIPDGEEPLASQAGAFLDLILAGDDAGARAILFPHTRTAESTAAAFDWMVRPALYELGARWEANTVSVVDEHLASGVVRRLLASLLLESAGDTGDTGDASGSGSREGKDNRRTVLVSAGERETHDIATQMIAVVFAKAGWRVRHLGADIPFDDLAEDVRRRPPDLVALSITMPFHYQALRAFLDGWRGESLERIPVLLGGSFFSLFTNMELPPTVLGIARTLTDGLALARQVLD